MAMGQKVKLNGEKAGFWEDIFANLPNPGFFGVCGIFDPQPNGEALPHDLGDSASS